MRSRARKMRPLQENQSSRRPTMRLRDPISSYKCFEAIATPSPIAPTTDGSNANLTDSRNLHRATSLDSLANSSEPDDNDDTSDNDDDDNDDDEDDNGENDISDVDSISDFGGNAITTATSTIKTIHSVQVHRKSDIEDLKNELPQKEPIIKAYLEKSHRKCDYKNCGYKKKNDGEPADCGGSTNGKVIITGAKVKDKIKEFKEKTSQNVSSRDASDSDEVDEAMITSSNQQNGTLTSVTSNGSGKTRRLSIASSGSVGRMETILEEPSHESKISVKEILARFETLNSLEVCFGVTCYFFSAINKYLIFFILAHFPWHLRDFKG